MRAKFWAARTLTLSLAVLPVRLSHAAVRTPTQVVVVGDSITAGYGASSFLTAYTAILSQLFGSTTKISAFGHPGATVNSKSTSPFVPYVEQAEYQGATNAVAGFAATEVVDVVIMLGTNDSAAQNWTGANATTVDQFKTEYTALVDHFAGLSSHPVVYLALSPAVYSSGAPDSANDCILHDRVLPAVRQVATEKSLTTINVYAATAGHPEYFLVAGTTGTLDIHPNDKGHQVIAQAMHDTLLDNPPAADSTLEGACDGGTVTLPEAGSSAGGSSSAGQPSTSGAGAPAAGGSSSAGQPAVPSAGSSPASAGSVGLPAASPPGSKDGCSLSSSSFGGSTNPQLSWFLCVASAIALRRRSRAAASRQAGDVARIR